MAISQKIEYAPVDDFFLDPKNPRLGRHFVDSKPTQDKILKTMLDDWGLEEIGTSFLESGFWTQEALVVVNEPLRGKVRMVVVEGNRRLAALKLLHGAHTQYELPSRWKEIIKSSSAKKMAILKDIPYVVADNRKEVQSYLGFRHVSGIKEWDPAEKAEFIARLVDDENLSYDQVRRRIGSKTQTVRQNYIAYRILRQMESQSDKISIPHVEKRFSILYLSLRTNGAKEYLNIDVHADPKSAKHPIPKSHRKNLESFALWLFGNDKQEPIVVDSRQVDRFGTVLESSKAIAYLERTGSPSFDVAYRYAGGDESETTKHIDRAADEIEEALGTVHHHKGSKRLLNATIRLTQDVNRLLELFPDIRRDYLSEGK